MILLNLLFLHADLTARIGGSVRYRQDGGQVVYSMKMSGLVNHQQSGPISRHSPSDAAVIPFISRAE